MQLTDKQLDRYSRQILLPEIDISGQQALLSSSVLIIGAGGLGSPAAIYLAASGIGKITICDYDTIDSSNLHRQILYQEADLGNQKAKVAANKLREINGGIKAKAITKKLDIDALEKEISTSTIVLDATDNFEIRYMINRTCWDTETPLVSGAAIRWEGHFGVFDPREPQSPCYQCLYKNGHDETLNCSETGVIGPLVGIIGTLQAIEVIKLIVGIGEKSIGKIFYIDGKRMEWKELKLNKNPLCLTCGDSDRKPK